jgi:hypothetical protein
MTAHRSSESSRKAEMLRRADELFEEFCYLPTMEVINALAAVGAHLRSGGTSAAPAAIVDAARKELRDRAAMIG